MAVFASLAGMAAIVLGLESSLRWDTPSGPSIVVAALVLFLAVMSPIGTLIMRLVRGRTLPAKAGGTSS